MLGCAVVLGILILVDKSCACQQGVREDFAPGTGGACADGGERPSS